MSSSNLSRATSFEIESVLSPLASNYASFQVNINTNSCQSRPYYSQIAILPINKTLSIFAFQTSSTVAILKCDKNEWKIVTQLELKDALLIKNQISCFEFPTLIDQDSDEYPKNLLIGYRNGLVLHVNYLTNKIINKYNILDTETLRNDIGILGIFPHPLDSDKFLVLFYNSILMVYSLSNNEENSTFLNEAHRSLRKTNLTKKRNSIINKKIDNYDQKFRYYDDKKELNFCFVQNPDKIKKNPLCFYYFNCNSIAQALFAENKYVREEYDCNVMFAFVGFDGYARIYDLAKERALFTYKSSYGGYSSISFNKDGDIMALGGHDDNISLVSLRNKSYFIRIEGHKSFITKAMIENIDEYNILRIYACSMDSFVSITDVDVSNLNKQNNKKNKEIPTKFVCLEYNAIRIKANNLKKINDEGVGNLFIPNGSLIACCYDGCVSVWNIEKFKPERKRTSNNFEKGNKENDEENIKK